MPRTLRSTPCARCACARPRWWSSARTRRARPERRDPPWWPDQQGEALLGEERGAARQEHANVGTHVLGRGADRPVGGRALDPRGGDQTMAGVTGPVVERWDVPGDAATPALRCGDRFGGSHPERIEHAVLDELPPRLPRNGFQDQSERFLAGVRVVEPGSGGEAHVRLSEGPQLTQALAGEIPAGRQSRGVRQEVVEGDRPGRGSDLEPRQVLGDLRVQIEPTRLVLLENGDGRERLADGSDLEAVLGPDELAGGEVRMTNGNHPEGAVTAREADGHPRCLDGREMAFDEPADLGDGIRRLPHGGPMRRRA